MPHISSLKKSLESICLAGMLSLSGCVAGQFKVAELNGAPSYDEVHSEEDIREVPFAYWNSADYRGNTLNLFNFISGDTSLHRAESVGNYLKREGIEIIGLGETDYRDTAKIGFRDQALDTAKSMGPPYNYVVVDQYMKSLIFPWTTGNAMISKYPMKVVHRHLYGENQTLDTRLGHLFKDFIHVKAKVGKRELNIILTHLDDGEGAYSFRRKKQVDIIIKYSENLIKQDPDIYLAVMGDMNKTKEDMQEFIKYGPFHPPETNFGIPTHSSDNPKKGISHVLVTDNMKIEDYDRFCLKDKNDEYISDHCGVKGKIVFLDNSPFVTKAYTSP